MSNELVGLENIPNVYISKIKLKDNDTDTFNCSIVLQVMDVMTSKGYIWKDEESFADFLRVGLVMTRQVDLAEAIKTGSQSPLPSKIVTSPRYNPFETEVVNFSIKEFTKVKKMQGVTSLMECQYYKKTTTQIAYETLDYAIFAFCYIDTVQLSNHFEIDLSGFCL